MILKPAGQPLYVGIDTSSKLLPIVCFPGSLKSDPIIKLYKLGDQSGPRAYAAGYRAAGLFIDELYQLNPDPSIRLNLYVYIERQVVYGGGRGNAVIRQAQCSGAIQARFAEARARVREVPNATWKKAVVGHGGADKRRVASTVRQRWPHHYRLLEGSQDLIDAYCIARYAAGVRTRPK